MHVPLIGIEPIPSDYKTDILPNELKGLEDRETRTLTLKALDSKSNMSTNSIISSVLA